MIILLDMDDVLADFDGEFYRKWNELHPDIPAVPPSRRKKFYLRDEMSEDTHSLIRNIYTAPGFIKSLPEIPNAVSAANRIAEKHDVFICTSPLDIYHNCVLEKYEWIEKHFGHQWTRKLILTTDKTLVDGDFLIDDKPDIFGFLTPRWKQILYSRSYNEHITSLPRITWDNYIEKFTLLGIL